MEEKSFKEQAYDEILTVLPKDRHCIFAFLSAVAKVTGSIQFVKRRMNLCLQLDAYEKATATVSLLKELYPVDFEIIVEHPKSGIRKGGQYFSVLVPSGFSKQVLTDLQLMIANETGFSGFVRGIPEVLLKDSCCKIAFLKGLFIACGSVYVPSLGDTEERKDGYHFEYQLEDEAMSVQVAGLLSQFGISAKLSERGQHYLVYLKDRDEILHTLGLLNLAGSVVKLSAIIDERETANSINRAAICEAANLDKTFVAASRQLLAIGMIEERDGLESLSPSLLDTARARMEYPQASLNELAEILGVTKSCLNHRLRKLTELAE